MEEGALGERIIWLYVFNLAQGYQNHDSLGVRSGLQGLNPVAKQSWREGVEGLDVMMYLIILEAIISLAFPEEALLLKL